jgi:ubiquinone/menaquinone biosynthesis C-methylase UbiE
VARPSPSRVGLARRWRATVRVARVAVLGAAARILRRVRPGQATEERLLRWTWATQPADALDEYLVVGWQNPRINLQSILIRHSLIRRIFGEVPGDAELMQGELAFAVELNEALRLEAERTNTRVKAFFNPRRLAKIRKVAEVIADRELEYRDRWRAALAARTADRLRVLELACGSANDYRAFADFGVAPFLDYEGIDLNPKNIANARRRFPDVAFNVGSALDLPHADGAVDVVLASDLLEHLPLEAIDRVVAEASRVARSAVILSFFNMAEIPEHEDRPVAAYHWNRLSRAKMLATLSAHFPRVTGYPINAWLKREFDYPHTYNKRAFTMIAERDAPPRQDDGPPRQDDARLDGSEQART